MLAADAPAWHGPWHGSLRPSAAQFAGSGPPRQYPPTASETVNMTLLCENFFTMFFYSVVNQNTIRSRYVK